MLIHFNSLLGCRLNASDGEIGTVRQIYFHDDNWAIEYFVVETSVWLAGRQVFISPAQVSSFQMDPALLCVDLTRHGVGSQPPIESKLPVSIHYQKRLKAHYDTTMNTLNRDMGGGGGTKEDAPEYLPEYDSHLRSSTEILSGYSLQGLDGEIGTVKSFILDDKDWTIRYLVVQTGPWLFSKNILLSPKWIEGISYPGSQIFINLPCSSINQAPLYISETTPTHEYEVLIHNHYNFKGYWDAVKTAEKSEKEADAYKIK